MGTYYGKLTVTDTSGNTDSSDFVVYVRSRISAEVTFKVISQSSGTNFALGYSYIYIESELGEKSYYNADEYGELNVVLPAGTYTVDAYKEGFMPKSFEITVSNGEEAEKILSDIQGKEFTVKTDSKTVGEALQAVEIIHGDMGDYGLYVKEVIGAHTANPLTGEFSVEVANAFIAEGGKLLRPVKKAMLAGNVFDILKGDITISESAKAFSGALVPQMRIPNLQVI